MLPISRTTITAFALSAVALVAVPSAASATVTCVQVSSSKDDAEERVSDGNMFIGSSDLDLETSKYTGMRFRNLPIAQGTPINYAYLTFTANDSDDGYAWMRIFGEDHNDAKNFDNEDYEISDRPLTDASMDWVPTNWSEGSEYYSPPVTDIVQEIVDRPAWVSGNDLALIVEIYAGKREAVSYDGNSADAPELCVFH